MATLVLKKFNLNYNPTSLQDDVVHVIGRQAGILGFLLSLAKIDPITEIKVNSERVEFRQASFFGQTTLTTPIPAITGIMGGYTKPKTLFFSTILFAILGLVAATEGVGMLIACWLISLILFILYILKKDMSLYLQNGGDNLWGLTFKRSIIENVAVDINKVNEAVQLINDRVLSIHRKN
jgi:hypothetical protein